MNESQRLANLGKYTADDLISIMALLRSENGCPWDKEQTHESIRMNFIEETYEVVEAIDTSDSHLLCEELGDVLLQVVFHARMSEESGDFSFSDVVDGICKKLVLRHPHIFGDIDVSTSDEVLKNWESIKNEEKGRESISDRLSSVPKSLPALMRAEKLCKRARDSGIDVKTADFEGGEDELGELLFSICAAAKKMKLDAERALSCACEKFVCDNSES